MFSSLSVCLFVCWQLCAKTSERICMKFSGKVGNGPTNKRLNFGGDLAHRLDIEIIFRIRHYWEIRKVVNGHSFIRICQMAALVRCALEEVCTVPVLLVANFTHKPQAGWIIRVIATRGAGKIRSVCPLSQVPRRRVTLQSAI